MKLCKTHVLCALVALFVTIPAYCQRGTLGVDAGQVSDKFGGLSSVTGADFDVNGELAVIQGKKGGGPSIVAGGEIRFPADTSNHAKEYAVFGGPMFQVGNLSIGFHAQLRKIILPAADVDNQIFNRSAFKLLELPIVLRYNFGPEKHAFIEAQGAPEFTPHYKRSSLATVSLPDPNFDHGYFVRGSAGYVFGKWYARVNYETRYFKFAANQGNPSGLYNWKSNLISGGVGFAF